MWVVECLWNRLDEAVPKTQLPLLLIPLNHLLPDWRIVLRVILLWELDINSGSLTFAATAVFIISLYLLAFR